MRQSPEKDYDVIMRRGYNDGNEGIKKEFIYTG